MVENWLSISGYDGLYEISDQGRVKSLRWGKIMKNTPDSNGYMTIGLRIDNKNKTKKVHALVLEAFVSPRPKGMECGHKDGTKDNNNVSNLAWVTGAENGMMRVNHGTQFCKLNNKAILDIREWLRQGNFSMRAIGEEFGVSTSTIWHIKDGRIWNHV